MYYKNNLNIIISLLILFAFLFISLTIYTSALSENNFRIDISARSAVLYQPDIDKFIFSKNADQKLPMASTTKIMTALIAIESCNFEDVVNVDDSAIGVEGSSAYIRRGEELTVEELLYALLLQSANDAAVALACHICGDVEEFSLLMNKRAKSIGAVNTSFTNPHGLDNADHYTTAKDLALITSEALKNENFKKIVSTYKMTFSNDERNRTYVNHNKLLKQYSGCIGVKTGYTKKSGRCLVSAAERDGLNFITVTLDAPDDWRDHSALLNYGYDSYERILLTKAYENEFIIPVLDGKTDNILVTNNCEAYVIKEKGDHSINTHVKLSRYVVAPIQSGAMLGEIIYTEGNDVICRVPLVACERVEKKEKASFLERLISIFR